MRKLLRNLLICLTVLLAVILPGCGDTEAPPENDPPQSTEVEEIAPSDDADAPFKVTMLDVGQGLSILIESDGEYMIYDGGGRSYSSYVVSYLKKHNIDELEYMFISHYDEDHIAGLVGVLNTCEVDTAVTPDYTADSAIYRSFRDMLKNNGADEEHPLAGDSYTLGNADIQVLSPHDYAGNDENDASIVIKVTYGNYSCIITGDAEENAESEMVSSGADIDADLYVVGHHGSASSSSESFVRAVSPEYAFISVGENNRYGHPAQQTIDLLNLLGIKIFRTDMQGEVTAFSDGNRYWVDSEPAEEEDRQAEPSDTGYDGTYVINRNSGKFHYPDCTSVDDMKEENKVYSDESRTKLIKEGYSPCGNCNP